MIVKIQEDFDSLRNIPPIRNCLKGALLHKTTLVRQGRN